MSAKSIASTYSGRLITCRATISNDSHGLSFEIDRMIPSSRVEHFTLEVVQAVQSRRLVQWCTEATNGTDHYICF